MNYECHQLGGPNNPLYCHYRSYQKYCTFLLSVYNHLHCLHKEPAKSDKAAIILFQRLCMRIPKGPEVHVIIFSRGDPFNQYKATKITNQSFVYLTYTKHSASQRYALDTGI